MRRSWRRYSNWKWAKIIIITTSTKPTTILSDKLTSKIWKCTNLVNNLTKYRTNESETCLQNKIFRPKLDLLRGSSLSKGPWQRSNRWAVFHTTLYKIQNSMTFPKSIVVASLLKGILFIPTPFRLELEWAKKSRREARRKLDKANCSLTNSYMRKLLDQMPIKTKVSSAC